MHAPNKTDLNLKPNKAGGQRGQIIPWMVIVVPVLIGFMALAIDVGYLFMVRGELQNDADAAALSGAGYLYQIAPPSPNWDLAQTKATEAIQLNRSGGEILTDGQVDYGYWNLTGQPEGLQSSSITPGTDDKPAVRVTISRDTGQNGGQVKTFFAPILNLFSPPGIFSYPVSAQAVAVVTGLGYTNVNEGLFPVVMPKCMMDNFWDPITNTPKPVNGSSYDIIIGSSYHYPGCSSVSSVGQWTSLDLGNNDVPTIRNLIDQASGKNPDYDTTKFDVGDNIWVETGVKNTVYNSVDACSARGDKSCEYSIFAIVCPNSPQCDDMETHVDAPIVGFACIHILGADGGSAKTITVQLVATSDPHCKTSGNSGGSGPNYGFRLTRLVM